MYIQGGPVESRTATHQNFMARSVTAPPPVIAQQYSSATLVLLRVRSCKDKFGTRFKNVMFFFYVLLTVHPCIIL